MANFAAAVDAVDIPVGETCLMKLVRRGICPCGFPVVQENVPLGKVYRIERWTALSGYDMTCGGCKKIHSVTVGLVIENGERVGKMVLDVMKPAGDA